MAWWKEAFNIQVFLGASCLHDTDSVNEKNNDNVVGGDNVAMMIRMR